MNEPPKRSSYFHNWISVIGGIFSVFLFAVLLFLFILDFWSKQTNPYLGAITYLILPVFLITSLLMIPVGALRERAKRQKRGYVRRFPSIDFNNPTHQKVAFATIGVTTLFLLFTMFGTYRAYEFTESVTFCGRLCHQVMEPEFTAYHHSPHARVACVQCHIGSGADWFVRSKLSGSYQVYSVIAKKYSKPIETPVKNLRPAQETCEQCHWPRQFFGAVEQDHQYFLSDEDNTAWKTRMLMFVGGGTPPYGKKEGIHWHMNIDNQVYYVASDQKRQEIPWVKRIRSDGVEEVYVDENSGFAPDRPPQGELRRMDCMDCHNRPSHPIAPTAERAVNEAMARGEIPLTLPFVRRETVKALKVAYPSQDAAGQGISRTLRDYYRAEYQPIYNTRRQDVEKAVVAAESIYRRNVFPEMNVQFGTYPNNIGHIDFPGCFRCHDDNHKSQDGKTIGQNCETCHSIQ